MPRWSSRCSTPPATRSRSSPAPASARTTSRSGTPGRCPRACTWCGCGSRRRAAGSRRRCRWGSCGEARRVDARAGGAARRPGRGGGPSDDSTYVTVNVPDWRSEGWAMALSAAAPGAGQLYVGAESGWWYLVGEAGGWAGRWLYRREANRYRGQAAALLGDPYDSTSAWSFQRFQARGGGDVSWLQTLWADDREGFYNAIQTGGYTAGFSGGAPFRSWVGLRLSADNAFR